MLALLLSLLVLGNATALAGDSGSTGPDRSEALAELLKTIDEAEGVNEESKRQLRERLIRLAERLDRFGGGVDQEAAVLAELEALREEAAGLTPLIDAILAAYEAGYGFDEIASILADLEPGREPDDPALASLVEVVLETELSEEESDAVLAALDAGIEPSGELNRGRLVSTMAHLRNLERSAERAGVELSAEQLVELVTEDLSGHLSDDEIEAIAEAALTSDRGMSEAVRLIKDAIPAETAADKKKRNEKKGNENREKEGGGPPAAASKGKKK